MPSGVFEVVVYSYFKKIKIVFSRIFIFEFHSNQLQCLIFWSSVRFEFISRRHTKAQEDKSIGRAVMVEAKRLARRAKGPLPAQKKQHKRHRKKEEQRRGSADANAVREGSKQESSSVGPEGNRHDVPEGLKSDTPAIWLRLGGLRLHEVACLLSHFKKQKQDAINWFEFKNLLYFDYVLPRAACLQLPAGAVRPPFLPQKLILVQKFTFTDRVAIKLHNILVELRSSPRFRDQWFHSKFHSQNFTHDLDLM